MITFDGIQFFKDFHIRYTTHSPNVSHGWAGTPCPFCNDRSDHLGLHIQTGAMNCWKCGKHSALDYVKAVLKVPAGEAKSLYTRYLTRSLKRESEVKTKVSSIQLPPPNVFTYAETNYMKARSITPSHITTYDLRGGGIVGDWAYRIVIPVYYNNYVISATARSIVDGVRPKYKSLSNSLSIIDLKHVFLGLDLVEGKTVAVVEGPLDAIRGGPGFISSFGASLSEEQLLLLREFDTIYFVRDSDEAGEQFVEEAYKLSAICTRNIEVVQLEGAKDVGAMKDDAILELRKELGL
jgi:DNA primase